MTFGLAIATREELNEKYEVYFDEGKMAIYCDRYFVLQYDTNSLCTAIYQYIDIL